MSYTLHILKPDFIPLQPTQVENELKKKTINPTFDLFSQEYKYIYILYCVLCMNEYPV